MDFGDFDEIVMNKNEVKVVAILAQGLEQLFVKFKSEWGHFRVSRALNAVSSNGVFGTNRDHFLRCRDLPLGFRYSGCARARAENRRRCLLRGLPGVLPSAAARGPKFAPVPRMCARKPGYDAAQLPIRNRRLRLAQAREVHARRGDTSESREGATVS